MSWGVAYITSYGLPVGVEERSHPQTQGVVYRPPNYRGKYDFLVFDSLDVVTFII